MSSLWTLATHTAKSMNWRRVRARGCWFKNHTHCSAVYVQHRKKIAQHFNRAKQSHQIPFTDSPWKIFVERVFSIYFVLFVFRCLSFSLSECAISMCLYNNHALPFATEMRNIFLLHLYESINAQQAKWWREKKKKKICQEILNRAFNT